MSSDYAYSVFINCPFDDRYLLMRNAMIFTVFDCGFIPRCALESDDSGEIRLSKITHLIEVSKYGIHDISRTEIDPTSNLPRFNMALELGVFLGARAFGKANQSHKNCLILDSEPYRYQAFMSDISGQDIQAHNDSPEKLITCIRNWLNNSSGRGMIPGGSVVLRRYTEFCKQLPEMCMNIPIETNELTYNDYCMFISEWLRMN